jgi:hypothetical protein
MLSRGRGKTCRAEENARGHLNDVWWPARDVLIYSPSGAAGARSSVVVKALGYKPEGLGFETRWGEILNLPNPSGLTRPWGSLSLLTEMIIANIKKNNVSGE